MVRSSTYFFLFLFLIACSNSSNQSVVNGEAFGTTWQIKFYKNTTDFKDQELELKINNELERIDSIFSLYDKNFEEYVTLKPLDVWYRFLFSDGSYFDYEKSK